MASTGRVLLDATVTDVGIGPFVYPACGQCYSKLIQLQDCRLHRCQNCGRSYSYGQEQFRYRLCLTVTDGTALASLTTFGGMLNVFFGVPAMEFHNILMSSAKDKYGASYGSIIQVAVEQAFIGQRLLFGLKTLSSNTRQTHSRHANGHSAISLRDICQSSITSSQKSMGRHLPDFIAVQIMPVTDSSFSATVVDCLRQLEAIIEECHLTADAVADRASLLQLLHLRPSSNGDKCCSFPHNFTRHVVQSPTANPSCDGTTDSSFDQSSLAFSCDDSPDEILVPKRPGLTVCTSQDPELTVCLPDWHVSVGDQCGECGSHHENGDSVMCDSHCDKDEIGHSLIRNCLTIQQTGDSEGMLKTHCELVGGRKCKTRSTDNCINGKLYDAYKNIQKKCGKRDVNRSKVKAAGGQCDTDRHKKKTFYDQSDVTKCEVNIACDHCGVKKHTVKRVCGQSDVGRHNVKTICDQRGVNRHNVKTLYDQRGLGRRKIQTICSQNDVNRLACVSASTNHKHKHGYVQGCYTNQDIVHVENKENVSQNVDTITTSCQVRHPLLKPAASSHQLSVQHSPVSVNKAFLSKRDMLKKRFSERHGFCLGVSLNTEAGELASTSCPGDFKDHSVEMAGISDSRKERQLTEDFSEQSLQKAHSKHVRPRLSHSDHSTIDATTSDKERSYHLARDADEKHKAQRYSEEICASENVLKITELVEDIPEELMEEYASKVMGDCLSKTREGTSSKLWEDYPESEGLDVFLSKIREDNQSNLMVGTPPKLREDNPSVLTAESASKLREDYPKSDAVFLANLRENNTSKLMEDYPSELMEDYPEFENCDVILSPARGDNLSRLREVSSSTLMEVYPESECFYALLSKVKEDHPSKLMEDYPSELMKDYPEFENLDVILSPTREDNLSKLREVSSSTLMEVYPESEGFGTFLSKVREDNPSKLMKAYPLELTKDYPQPGGHDVCLLSLRGDNPSQLGDGCTLNLRNYPSKFMEDYPESEGLGTFLTKLNSPTTDRSDHQSLSMSAEKGSDEIHMKKLDDTAVGCTDHRTRMSSMLHDSTNDHSDCHSQSIAAEKTADGILTEKLHGTAADGHDYRKGMSSNPHSCLMLECEIDGCDTEESCSSAVRLPSLALIDYGHFETPRKETLSLLLKSSQRQRTVQSDKSRKRHGAFWNMTTWQKRGVYNDDKNSLAHSTPRHICSSGNHGATRNVKVTQTQIASRNTKALVKQDASKIVTSIKTQGASRNTKALVKQDASKNVTSIKTQGASRNTKALVKQDFSKNVKSVKKQNGIRNFKSVKKHSMSPAGVKSRKQALFQAVQAGQKAREDVKDLKTHKLHPNVNTPPVRILFPAFKNHEKTYNTAYVSKSCRVGDSDIFNGCEKLTLSTTVRNQNKQTLCQNVTNAVKEMSLQNVTHSAEQTLSLPAVNSVESSEKCKIQKKQIIGHSEKQAVAEKVTRGQKLVVLKSCQNQERNTLPQRSKNVKKNTFLQSGTNLGEQAVILNVTTQKKWPSQHTIRKLKKHTLSVNYTSSEQIQQTVKTSTKGAFFPEYTTPMEIPQQNRKSTEEMNLSVNSANLKQQTSQKVESSHILSLKYKTPQLLTSLGNCKDARRKVILNYATPKQTLPRIMKNADKTLSYLTPKQTLQRNMNNSEKTLSSNHATRKQTLQRNVTNSEKTVSSNNTTPNQQTGQKILTISGEYISPASDTTSKYPMSQQNVTNTEHSTLTKSSKNTEQGVLQLAGTTPATDYNTQSIDLNSLSANVTLRRSKRKYHTDKLHETNNTTSTDLFAGESTNNETLCFGQVSDDVRASAESPTGKMSRLSHLDPWRESGDLFQITDSLFHAHSGLNDMKSDRKVRKDSSIMSDRNVQNESSCMSDRIVQKDSSIMSDRSVQNDSSCMSERIVQKDSSIMSDRNVQNDSSCISDRIVQKDSSIMSDINVQNDSRCMFDRYVQKDSNMSHQNFQKAATRTSGRNVGTDNTSISDKTVSNDSTALYPSNVQTDSSRTSDKAVPKGSRDRPLQSSICGQKSTVHDDGRLWDASTTHPGIPQTIWQRGCKQSSGSVVSLVSFMQKTNKSVCVVSKVFPPEGALDSLSGPGDYRLGESFCPSGSQGRKKDKFAGQQVGCLRNSGCNTDTMDVDSHVRKIIDLSDRAADITDKYDVAEIADMKGCVTEIMDTNGHIKGILHVTDNVAEITDIGDCLTEITDMNNCITEITDFNDSVTKITDVNNHITEIAGVNSDTAEIRDKNGNVTGMSLLKDFSGSCEVLWDCPGYDVSDDSSVRELDVRWQSTDTTQRLDVEVFHVRGECTEQHIDYGHLSTVPEEAFYPQREHDKRFICATCPKRACAIFLNCDLGSMKAAVDSGSMKASVDLGSMKASVDSGSMKASVDSGSMKASVDSGLMKAAVDSGSMKASVDSGSMKASLDSGLMKAAVDSGSMKASVDSGSMKASVDSGMCPKRLETTEAASDVFSPQARPHLAEDIHDVLSDSFSDLFTSPEDDSVFVSEASHDNEFRRETCEDVVQKSWLLPKSNMVSARLHRSCSESTDGTSIASQWQREICGHGVQETLLLHQAYPASDESQRSYSMDQSGNVSERCQVAKQVRFSNKNREHNYFAFEAISHRPVVIQNMPYLKSSLKKSDTEWELAGSQDLFSEPSQDLAVGNVSVQVEPGHCRLNDEWNSSCELFSQTPEQPSRKCTLSTHHITPADHDPASVDTNTPRISRIGGVIMCAQSETLLTDHSFDLFTPSPSNRNKVNSVSLFSPEVCNYPTQLCITPDLFS